jgi:hypothetical protein
VGGRGDGVEKVDGEEGYLDIEIQFFFFGIFSFKNIFVEVDIFNHVYIGSREKFPLDTAC